jgi:hypothetical protein
MHPMEPYVVVETYTPAVLGVTGQPLLPRLIYPEKKESQLPTELTFLTFIP